MRYAIINKAFKAETMLNKGWHWPQGLSSGVFNVPDVRP